MTYEIPEPAPDRRPALALFAGGLLSGAAIVVLGLTLTGVIRPVAAEPTSSQPSAASAELAGGPLVTPPPIASPAAFTPTELAHGQTLGRANAPVTVEVWADYQCPYCALFTAQVEPQLIAQYVETGQVRLVFRDLAFLGDESRWAAVAARLAEQQDAFWPYHDYLFANQLGENRGGYSVDRLREIASQVGLDRDAFDAGLQLDDARATFARIRTEFEADAARLGIRSTPTIVVNDRVVEGNDLPSIRAAIDKALARLSD
jgi:protein-disulfide isomerase